MEIVEKVQSQQIDVEKAINHLKGILLGIKFDNPSRKDLTELHLWVKSHFALADRNPFSEFMATIEEMMSSEKPDSSMLEDLLWLCQKHEGDSYYFNAVNADLQTLRGISHGILADGKITDTEITALASWLNENDHLNTYYPYDELRAIVMAIVADNKIENSERLIMKAYLNQFVDIKQPDLRSSLKSETSGTRISAHCAVNPEINFKGKTFCITGLPRLASREQLKQRILAQGGIPAPTVSPETDYLIVGDNGNPAWAFACYGRQVEIALDLLKKGHIVLLIHEFDLIDALNEKESPK